MCHCPPTDPEWSGLTPTETCLCPFCQEQQWLYRGDGTWLASWKEMAELDGLACEATPRLATRKTRVTRGSSGSMRLSDFSR